MIQCFLDFGYYVSRFEGREEFPGGIVCVLLRLLRLLGVLRLLRLLIMLRMHRLCEVRRTFLIVPAGYCCTAERPLVLLAFERTSMRFFPSGIH